MKTGIVKRIIIFTVITAIVFMSPSAVRADLIEARNTGLNPYRIMCISSYNYSFPTVPDQLDGLVDGLDDLPVDIDFEFMDSKNYYKAADFLAFHDYLSHKMAQSEPYDLLVLLDDTALHFGLNYYDEIFKDMPIVFANVNNQSDAEVAAARPNITGTTLDLDFEANLNLVRKLFPDRNNIVIVTDNTSTAQGEYTEFIKYYTGAKVDDLEVTVINSSFYSKKGFERAVSEINDSNSIIFYLSCMEDGEGNIYTLKTGTNLITLNAPDVPIWRFTLADMQSGIFGGISYSYYDAGVKAGNIVAKILSEGSMDNIELERIASNHAYFDQVQMDRFEIKIKDLPEGATILNEHRTLKTLYAENPVLVNIVILFIVLLILVVAALLIINLQRRNLINQDYLTRMPNRQFINTKLKSVSDSKTPFGIIMMDVDYYKEINDTKGHNVGDQLLISIGARLKSFPKKDVIFARIGGDEFMGIIYNASKEKADALCRSLISKMCEEHKLPTGNINITVSVGVAVYPIDTDDAENLRNYADAALYEVKKNGRNGYRSFKPEYLKNIEK